jgi:hypothetical protein
MPASQKYALSTAIVLGVTVASLLAMKILPNGELWLITTTSSVCAYLICTRVGWLALVFVPFFPFLIFILEMDKGISEKPSFVIAIAAWSVFALAAIAGSLRWWKRLRNAEPSNR